MALEKYTDQQLSRLVIQLILKYMTIRKEFLKLFEATSEESFNIKRRKKTINNTKHFYGHDR